MGRVGWAYQFAAHDLFALFRIANAGGNRVCFLLLDFQVIE